MGILIITRFGCTLFAGAPSFEIEWRWRSGGQVRVELLDLFLSLSLSPAFASRLFHIWDRDRCCKVPREIVANIKPMARWVVRVHCGWNSFHQKRFLRACMLVYKSTRTFLLEKWEENLVDHLQKVVPKFWKTTVKVARNNVQPCS